MEASPQQHGPNRDAGWHPVSPLHARGNGPLVRVLLADDDPDVRHVIGRLVSGDDALELVGTASDAEEAVELGSLTHPDVALVDLWMPKGGGFRAARELRERSPETKVLALSGSADREGVLKMFEAGAVGYMIKGANVDVVEGIMAASRGEGVIANEVAAEVIGELRNHLDRQNEAEQSELRRRRRIGLVIEGRAIAIAFQPVFDLSTGKVACVEALARFPGDEEDDPEAWFAEAWSLGLGVELEIAAFAAALEAGAMRPAGVLLAVNVSPGAAMSGRFCEFLASLDDVDGLVLELTEHAVVEDYDVLTGCLGPVRDRGIKVAVDDAGSGHASLRHILQVEPEFIKLDMSLLSGIEDDQPKLALTTGITSFAREISTKTVAEGIETRSQLECVMGLGVDYAQGYHLERPGALPKSGRRVGLP